MHRNTLLYRLIRRVKEITSLDPKQFDEAVQLRMPLKMGVYQEGNKFKQYLLSDLFFTEYFQFCLSWKYVIKENKIERTYRDNYII